MCQQNLALERLSSLKLHRELVTVWFVRIRIRLTLEKMLQIKFDRSHNQLAASSNTANRSLKADDALLLVAASEGDSNMLYAVGFFVPDPFIFFQHKKKKYVVMSDLAIFHYKQSSSYDRASQFTLLWNDPAFNFWWPVRDPIVSRRDLGLD